MEHRKQSTHRCYAPARNGCQACASTLAAQELELESFKQAVQDAQKQVEELESDQTITTQLEQTGKNEICFAGWARSSNLAEAAELTLEWPH